MMITNSQYQAIITEYDRIRTANRHVLEDRKKEIFARIPEYKEISDSISSLCIARGKQMLLGDGSALDEMKKELHALSEKKAKLLTENGYPADYLEPVYTCKDCQDTGYLPDKSKCRCMKQKMIAHLYEQSGLMTLLQTENFDHLSMEYYDGEDRLKFEKAVQSARNFIEGFGSHYRNLFFCGTVGTGKSFLSCCIAKELLEQGYSVMYFSAGALFDKIAEFTFRNKDKEALAQFKHDLLGCDLLIIDDLGTEIVNSFITSELFSCLNERHLHRKSTIVSSNLSIEELREYYSDRVFSRMISNFDFLKFTGQDIRKYKKFNHQ
ncbi:MAG: ATP-binding protein [Lachnospiraceae bacterium]|nr:ATP-binding protein [Lachnospiraceae bacterium]